MSRIQAQARINKNQALIIIKAIRIQVPSKASKIQALRKTIIKADKKRGEGIKSFSFLTKIELKKIISCGKIYL